MIKIESIIRINCAVFVDDFKFFDDAKYSHSIANETRSWSKFSVKYQ